MVPGWVNIEKDVENRPENLWFPEFPVEKTSTIGGCFTSIYSKCYGNNHHLMWAITISYG